MDCESCGAHSLVRHCPSWESWFNRDAASRTCDLARCLKCKAYGIPGKRWVNMKEGR